MLKTYVTYEKILNLKKLKLQKLPFHKNNYYLENILKFKTFLQLFSLNIFMRDVFQWSVATNKKIMKTFDLQDQHRQNNSIIEDISSTSIIMQKKDEAPMKKSMYRYLLKQLLKRVDFPPFFIRDKINYIYLYYYIQVQRNPIVHCLLDARVECSNTFSSTYFTSIPFFQ